MRRIHLRNDSDTSPNGLDDKLKGLLNRSAKGPDNFLSSACKLMIYVLRAQIHFTHEPFLVIFTTRAVLVT